MKAVVRNSAKKYIERLDAPTKKRIKAALEALAQEPPLGDIKQLKDTALRRLRVGEYRITFFVTGTEIIVDRVGPRGDVCKGL